MPDILDDFSTPALIQAVWQNLYELFSYLSKWEQTDFYASPKLQRWWTPVPYPWYNGVLSLTAPEGDETATIQETIDYFRARDRTLFTWWLALDGKAEAWGTQLEANGLKLDRDTPGMAADLAVLNEDFSVSADLEIKRVGDEAGMKNWARIFVRGYELPPDWELPVLEMMLATGLDYPCFSYLATINGEPVATSAVFLGAGVAGIQMVTTLPEWRGKGIGAAATLAPLGEARQLGYRIGILQSSALGYKVYQRLGFKELCRMRHYAWLGG